MTDPFDHGPGGEQTHSDPWNIIDASPLVFVEIFSGLTADQLRELAKQLTTVADHLDGNAPALDHDQELAEAFGYHP